MFAAHNFRVVNYDLRPVHSRKVTASCLARKTFECFMRVPMLCVCLFGLAKLSVTKKIPQTRQIL